VACLAGLLLVSSCDQREQIVAGGSDETHSSVVDIQGRVLTKDARPFGNVIVRLRGLGLLDTTDSDGRFRFRRDSLPVAARAASAVDTVDYLRDGQSILSAPVPAWVSTLPDVMLVQRDLSGSLEGDLSRVARVVAVLNLPDDPPQEIDLELIPATRQYSGFAYFRYVGGLDTFAIHAEALDDSGRMVGRSGALVFTSRAGDIRLPPFGAANAVPRVAITAPPSAARRAAVPLHIAASDSFGRVRTLEWCLDGRNWVAATLKGIGSYAADTSVMVPADAKGSWIARARVTDKEGLRVEDSVRIAVSPAPPMISISVDSFQADPGSPVVVHLADSDAFGGRVVSRKLHLGTMANLERTFTWIDCFSIVFAQDSGWSVHVLPLPKFQECPDAPTVDSSKLEFMSLRQPLLVSGRDTAITLPIDSVGRYQLLYEVKDDDGDITVRRSFDIVVRPKAPRIESLSVQGSSAMLRWTAPAPEAALRPGDTSRVWIVRGSWGLGGIDTFRLELPDSARSAVLPRPWTVGPLNVRIFRRIGGIEGRADSLHRDSLPGPVQSFDLALEGTGPGRATAVCFGGAMARLALSDGWLLPGRVARLEWTVPGQSAWAGATLVVGIPPLRRPRTLHAVLSNASPEPARIVLSSPTVEAYRRSSEQGYGLGWTVPAGFVGPIDLALDAATWPSWSPAVDSALRAGIDREAVFGAIEDVRLGVDLQGTASRVSGNLEVDDLSWE